MVEVVVVIGIVGILTAIVFPSISNIRAKNRDAERVADISAIQLGLSLYYSQHDSQGYPSDLETLVPKYVPADAVVPPTDRAEDKYYYVPLKRNPGDKCIYYHLGAKLELTNAQIDTANTFSSSDLQNITNGYKVCGDQSNYEGIPDYVGDNLMYSVRP